MLSSFLYPPLLLIALIDIWTFCAASPATVHSCASVITVSGNVLDLLDILPRNSIMVATGAAALSRHVFFEIVQMKLHTDKTVIDNCTETELGQ